MPPPARLPRAFCAGLIEASTIPATRCRGRGGYPVLFARASLKRVRMATKGTAGKMLPRAFCAGLIEAQPCFPWPFRPPCYPVLFARASLKPPLRRVRRAGEGALPRAFCAGLIEASIRILRRQIRHRLPRAFCAGLIEAQASFDRMFSAN